MRFSAFYVAGGALLAFGIMAGSGALLPDTPIVAALPSCFAGLLAIFMGAFFEATNTKD